MRFDLNTPELYTPELCTPELCTPELYTPELYTSEVGAREQWSRIYNLAGQVLPLANPPSEYCSMKLAFIIPFRSPRSARNFEKCERELRRTVAQAQSAGGGDCVFVGASDAASEGDAAFDEYGATVVPSIGAPEPASRRDLLLDKAVKRYLAINEAAARDEFELFAMLDADDLVSDNYARAVGRINTDKSAGIVIDAAYVFDLVDRKLQIKYGINKYCGSTLVFTRSFLSHIGILRDRSERRLTTFADVVSSIDNDLIIDILGEHCNSKEISQNLGFPMKVLNEPIVTWLVHNENNVSQTKLPNGSMSIDQAYLSEFGLSGVEPRVAGLRERVAAFLRKSRSRAGQIFH